MTLHGNVQLDVSSLGPQLPEAADGPAFVYRHIVSFEETNLVGNVYFSRHVSWQGRCREMFLKAHAPGILAEMTRDLRLVTLRVSCEYFAELRAFQEVEIQMRLAFIRQHRLGLDFAYHVVTKASAQLAAHGFQEIGCMRAEGEALFAIAPPSEMISAFHPFMARQP